MEIEIATGFYYHVPCIITRCYIAVYAYGISSFSICHSINSTHLIKSSFAIVYYVSLESTGISVVSWCIIVRQDIDVDSLLVSVWNNISDLKSTRDFTHH